jgi:hypothetical protein
MRVSKLAILAISCLALTIPQLAAASTYVTFNVPNSSNNMLPTAVNKWGSVTGYYEPISSETYSGFIYQSSSGHTTTFSVPIKGVSGTYPLSINDSGWVVGYYTGGSGAGYHGFLRNPKYTTIDVPGAGTAYNQGTEALSLNDAGVIAGIYWDAASVEHGFIRDASGNYTSFDVPGGSAVISAVLNQSGEVAGTYNVDTTGGAYPYGYVMDTTGKITTFDVPGSAYGATVSGINGSGEVTGSYYPSTVSIQQFVRDQFGNITTFNVAGYNWTAGIEDNGNVVGTYQTDDYSVFTGWQMVSSGSLTHFLDPGSGPEGTVAWCVSGNGKVAGYYWDSSGNAHGFLKTN